ncbi:MAG: hypothetical protein GY845_11625 [Planctomycetes bacterium]|nr:hypothetical protein [Planctomycetota bacterium]
MMQGDNMKDKDVDKYLSYHLSGSPPREAFKQQALRDSTATLVRVRRRRTARRRAVCAVAAVLIAGIAFIGGRLSVPRNLSVPLNVSVLRKLPRNVDIAPQAAVEIETDSVNVPSDVVVWLDAARLFKRLGMEERMIRAFEYASELTPYDAVASISTRGQALAFTGDDEVFDNQNKRSILTEILDPHMSVGSISGIMAQSFGDYYYENEMD